MSSNNKIPFKLLKKWREDYKSGRSDVNPDCKDFTQIYEYLERTLYNSHGRSHTKSLVVTNGDETSVEGPLLSTKEYNTLYNEKNTLIDDKGFLDSDKKQYVENTPRKYGRRDNSILREDRLKRSPRYELHLKHKKSSRH